MKFKFFIDLLLIKIMCEFKGILQDDKCNTKNLWHGNLIKIFISIIGLV